MKTANVLPAALGAIMMVLSTAAVAGGKSSDAYFVRVDRDTTTQNSSKAPDVKQVSRKDASSGMATGKRQHKPVVVTKPVDKASPAKTGKLKKSSVPDKAADVTLKRGVID